MNLELYVLSGREFSRGRPQEEVLEEALLGGATAIQLREKNISGRELVELACKLQHLAHRYGATFLVNDRVDIALLSKADGVHLGQEDIPARLARDLLGPGKIIGVSVGNEEEAKRAEEEGADYVGLGPFFPTGSKADAGEPIGLETLGRVKEAVRIPVVAIGGIKEENAREIVAAGADGVAVISAVIGAPHVQEAAQALLAQVRAGKEVR